MLFCPRHGQFVTGAPSQLRSFFPLGPQGQQCWVLVRLRVLATLLGGDGDVSEHLGLVSSWFRRHKVCVPGRWEGVPGAAVLLVVFSMCLRVYKNRFFSTTFLLEPYLSRSPLL